MKSIFALLLITIISCRHDFDLDVALDLYQFARAAFCNDQLIESWSCSACARNQGALHTKVPSYSSLRSYNRICWTLRAMWRTIQPLIELWPPSEAALPKSIGNSTSPSCTTSTSVTIVVCTLASWWLGYRSDMTSCRKSVNYSWHTPPPNCTSQATAWGQQLLPSPHSTCNSMITMLRLSTLWDGILSFCRTFSPRLGNAGFSTFFNSKVESAYRIVHNADVFPQLPPRFLGFQHYGREIWLNEDSSEIRMCSPINSEDPAC